MSRKPRKRKGPSREQTPKPLLVQPHPVLPTCKAVVERVAQLYGCSVARMLSRKNGKKFAEPRQMAMWACRYLLGTSYPNIGRATHRDWTTPMKRIREMKSEMGGNSRYAKHIEFVMGELQQPHVAYADEQRES